MAKFANVDDYIATLPENLREVAVALRPNVDDYIAADLFTGWLEQARDLGTAATAR